jgi:hypothetical protein
MLNIPVLVFEIKEGKNAQKVKNIVTIIHHYLLEEDSNGQRSHVWGHTPLKLFKI